MKNSTHVALAVLFFTFSFISAQSQQNQKIRCSTDIVMEQLFKSNPKLRVLFNERQRELEEKMKKGVNDADVIQFRTTAMVSIPVVVHIMLPNPNLVTNATVQSQLDTLNWFYGGASATDSLRVYAPFRTTYGRTKIRFCLAQRTPQNTPTTGINRYVNNSTYTAGNGAIQSTALGGVDPWNTQKYLNIWVTTFSDNTLGYAYLPGTFPPGDPHYGFVCDYRSFGAGATYLYPEYNQGKTCVHEIGHFFNLYHPWSGANNAASNPTCTFSDLCDDTPPTNGPTFGCPSFPVLNSCSPAPPGIMIQNHMDYADDRCMVLFTVNQATRMENAFDNSPDRVTLQTSNGCTPVSLQANDAGISSIVTPATGNSTCDATSPLVVTLLNAGSNALTSVTITVAVNTVIVQTFNWTGNLASLASVNVTLNAVNLNLGNNTITVTTSNPNGSADPNPTNDAAASSINRGAGIPLPIVESFTSATFPPSGWTIINPDAAQTWARRTAQSHSAPACAWINNYNYNGTGQRDALRAPNVSIGTADSFYVSFWYAYNYDGTFGLTDSLEIRVSGDCGNSFTRVFKKGGVELATAAPVAGQFTPVAADWRRVSIDLSSYIAQGKAIVEFTGINGFGNNLFLDDINIDRVIFPNRDASVISIDNPQTRVCKTTDKPVVTFKNLGKDPLTSVKVNYQVDGGAVTTFSWTGGPIPRNGVVTVTLADANLGAVGNHVFKAYTSEPNGLTDQNTSNDTLTKAYTVYPITPLTTRVEEGFNSATFPPPGWVIFNPDGDFTWQRTALYGKNQLGAAWFNDYDNATTNRFDDLRMPNYSYSGIDSIFLNFQLSTVTFSYPGTTTLHIDTMSVLVSRDCGNTFTNVYKKWGKDLQTVGDPNFPQADRFFPTFSNLWRKDSINLGKFLGTSEPLFQVAFRFNGNFENNIFLDDVNLYTQTLPAKLKNQGYLLLPSPFQSTFGVWHYQQPTTLKYISVYNSVGHLIWKKQFSGNADKYIQVDLTGKPAGMYVVQLGYDDNNRNISQRIIKY